jgi:hypothetical protein
MTQGNDTSFDIIYVTLIQIGCFTYASTELDAKYTEILTGSQLEDNASCKPTIFQCDRKRHTCSYCLSRRLENRAHRSIEENNQPMKA